MYALTAISTTDCARQLQASRLAADAYLTKRSEQKARDDELRARVKPISSIDDTKLRARVDEESEFKVKAASAAESAPKKAKKSKNLLLDPSFYASTSVTPVREAPKAAAPSAPMKAPREPEFSWRQRK